MSRATTRILGLAGVLLLEGWLVACGGPEAPRPPTGRVDLAGPFVKALREEATGDPAKATALYMKSIESAAGSPSDPYAMVVMQASLDALVSRRVPALAEVTDQSALAYRTHQVNVQMGPRIAAAMKAADDPFSPALAARVLEILAVHRGNAEEAGKWRNARGCAQEATVVGPLDWAPVSGIKDADPLEKFDAPIPAQTSLPGPFATKLAPVIVRGRGCGIDLAAASALGGVRDVVVDVTIAKAQRIGVGLRAHGAALLRAGGRVVLERPYELGSGEAARFATVDAKPGKLRLVARVGLDTDGQTIEIGAWDEHGRPLPMHAPKPGETADLQVTASQAIDYPRRPRTDDERVAVAAGALAAGDGRFAERIVNKDSARKDAPPELSLVYARAVETARDLSSVIKAERERAACERVLEAWPTSWEAILAHSVLAGVRRGQTEARIEMLKDLAAHRAKAGPFATPLLDVFEAATAGRDALFDRAKAAYDRASTSLAGTSVLVDAGYSATFRVGAERVAYACAQEPPHERNSFSCHDALWQTGNRKAAMAELERLRGVRGGPDLFLGVSLREALADGDTAGAIRVQAAMLPGERTLAGLFAATPKIAGASLREAAITARDAPTALPPLLHAAGEDPTKAFDGVAEKITAADRANPILPSAATAVLAHVEKYDVEKTGLVHFVMLDVRRVSGTTDVEENAQAETPDLSGREVLRVLRRRIFKKDGRVLEPDRTPHASQSHADLSQLEQGDAVEAIYEGWSLPGETGNIGIDTPDLLPDRTGVHDATIELRLPKGLHGSLWTHALLGKAHEASDGDKRVLTWKMTDHPVRRLEDGTPKMDRSVSVSFATAQWGDVARALRETIATLDEHDPEIAEWAHDAGKKAAKNGAAAPSQRAVVDAVVEAAGTSVKEASPALFTEVDVGRLDGPQAVTARTILTNREGNRTWLIVRALRELGVKADVVVAENEPFSADPAFPPHFGRFMHPLAVAHVAGENGATSDVWIDADVPGPPLPAGRISPELRGRSALYADGTIAALPQVGTGAERDEVDIRLVVDAKGDAKGVLTVLLRGRAAQELAQALVRIVGADRQRALRAVALAWVPFANVDDVQLSSSEGSWQVALRAEVSIGGYAQLEGAGTPTWILPGIEPLHTVFPRAYTTTLGATYAGQGARENALAINQAIQYHAHRRVELPPGATVARMPGPFDTKSPYLEATRKIAVNSNVIEEEFALGITTGTVPASRYGAFVTDAHKTDDAFLASTRVKPGS